MKEIVNRLAEAGEKLIIGERSAHLRHELPSRDRCIQIVEVLRSVLFPGYFGTSELSRDSLRYHIGANLDWASQALKEQVLRGLCSICKKHDPSQCPECHERANGIVDSFVTKLPDVGRVLMTDADAAYKGDPAATSREEAIFSYPGLLAITNQRLAHELNKLGVPLIPRIITEHAHSITGIDIHPGAKIDEEFFIDHGTGVVIGETCVIGKRVRIYQGVTLGAKSFPLDERGNPIKGIERHPIIEDDVIIYAGATILGRIRIGKGSVIGGNVWITSDLPAGSRISQVEAR